MQRGVGIALLLRNYFCCWENYCQCLVPESFWHQKDREEGGRAVVNSESGVQSRGAHECGECGWRVKDQWRWWEHEFAMYTVVNHYVTCCQAPCRLLLMLWIGVPVSAFFFVHFSRLECTMAQWVPLALCSRRELIGSQGWEWILTAIPTAVEEEPSGGSWRNPFQTTS